MKPKNFFAEMTILFDPKTIKEIYLGVLASVMAS